MILLTVFLLFLAIPVRADTTAPTVPDSGRDYFPKTQDSFGAGLREVLKNALPDLAPDFSQAMAGALGVLAAAMLTGVLSAVAEDKSPVMELGGVVAVGVLMLSPARNSIRQGVACVEELTEYGRLLLPVMTSAMAAQGGVTAATALYAGTAVFTALLSTVISKFVVPMVYLFLALSVANGACGNLDKLRDLLKWLITWCLKALMMGFSAYMGITGVLSGSVDAAALKATKLAIGGMVPVVGGMLSDASETVLVSAGLVKNAAGVYGLLAVLAVWIGPFLRMGAQYLVWKGATALCGLFAPKRLTGVVSDFSTAMGLLLAMLGTVCLFWLVSTVCFLKGVGG